MEGGAKWKKIWYPLITRSANKFKIFLNFKMEGQKKVAVTLRTTYAK